MAFVVTGDFNKANFRTIATKYFQLITINTRGDRVLDHCYSPFRDAYKSLPRPPFGKSDHSSVLLLPAYRQELKREAPALRTIQCWSDQSEAMLQDCFDHVDWDMFRAASDDDIEVYSDTVMCFIRKCVEQGLSNLFLEGRCPTEFSSKLPQHTCLEVSSLPSKTLISCFRCV